MENLIQELVKTPRWSEFDDWFFVRTNVGRIEFKEMDFMFQKGVFEKFIEENGYEIYNDSNCYNLYKNGLFILNDNRLLNYNSFQELLIYFFNLNN